LKAEEEVRASRFRKECEERAKTVKKAAKSLLLATTLGEDINPEDSDFVHSSETSYELDPGEPTRRDF